MGRARARRWPECRRPRAFSSENISASSSSLGSANGNPVEVKLETSGSLIDFDADIEPAPAAAVPQAQQTSVTQSYSQPVNSDSDNNWASFDVASQVKVSQAPAIANSLESLLSQLSVSATVPSYVSGTVGNTGAFTAAGQMTAPFGGNSVITPVGRAMFPTATGSHIIAPVASMSHSPLLGLQWQTLGWLKYSQPMLVIPCYRFLGNGLVCHISNLLYSLLMVFSLPQQYIPSVGGASSNQPWNLVRAPNAQVQPSNPATQAPQDVSIFNHNVSTISSQPSARDVKAIGRSELPADFFAMNYSSFRTPVPGWQTGPPHGMGFAMQYNTAVLMPTFLQLLKSGSSFDVNTWMPLQSSSYLSGLPLQAPPYALASQMPPSAYMGQQIPISMPPSGYQGAGGFGAEGAAFGSLNI
ncbi:hypothetical protein M0R45_003196 [Rubus argutus]|uniref:Uncharacterized protein n=1 Tax=Rubus argutus TaxID=59490 RepID=A0AAW1YH66_RUBAR